MIEFAPGAAARAQDAIEHLVNTGQQKAMYRLMGAGFAIAKTTQALGTLRHGQLLGKPRVRQVDDETVSVGFKAARSRTVAVLAKNLRLAKAKEWPRALRG